MTTAATWIRDELDRQGNAGNLILFFPRTNPLTVEDNEVEFAFKLGNLNIKKKFKLKDMMFDGKLYGWCGNHSDVDHIASNRLQCSVHDALEHWSGDPAVSTDNDTSLSARARQSPGAESGREFRDNLGC